MFIRHLTIQNLGSLPLYDEHFSPELNLIDSRHTDEIAAAMAFLLCSQSVQEIPEGWLQADTRICAEVCLADTVYRVLGQPRLGRLQRTAVDPTGADVTEQYQYALCHCPEQDTTETFDGQDKAVALQLFRYRNREEQDGLSLRTRRFADTQTFRTFLFRYIRNFRPERISCAKDYYIALDPEGKFQVFCPGTTGGLFLSETEEKLFRYLCFLHIAEFWKALAFVRDLHHESKPLFIRNFIEHLDESVNISTLLTRTWALDRQIILFATPLDENTKKKWIGDQHGIFFKSGDQSLTLPMRSQLHLPRYPASASVGRIGGAVGISCTQSGRLRTQSVFF